MFKKAVVIGFLIVMITGVVGVWQIYSAYQQRRAERLARMQQKVEEVSVTTIEGWTVSDIAQALEKQGFGNAKDFEKLAETFDTTSYPLTQRPAKTDLEGYLFPDTYRFAKTESQESIMGKMLKDFTNRLGSINISSPSDSLSITGYEGLTTSGGDNKPGFSLYDIIIVASMIEKESGGKGAVSDPAMNLDEERRLVASVFYNRLQIGKALESDATINYVTGKNDPGVSSADQEINSPYNTYKYPGLPPGPICNPSLGSIKAALNPAKSDYFYFLHKQPSGQVEFSKTFEEHVKKKLE
jgi:UPF0755 protein